MGRGVRARELETRVGAQRHAAGLTQAELARKAGLTRQTISAIEAGQYVPNTAVALRLAQALGCAVEDLFVLPETSQRVDAEFVGGDLRAAPARVRLSRVGDRLLARPFQGHGAALSAADGLVVSAGSVGRGPVAVDLQVDPSLIEKTVVVAGCDPSLALLGAHLTRRYPSFRLQWVQSGSLSALRALGRQEAHAAGSHLRDPQSGEENLPFIRRELAGRNVTVIALSQWQQGLIVARGNPKGISGPADLGRPDLSIVNREAGSGSRALLDHHLTASGLVPADIAGYTRELDSHFAVAEVIAAGLADAGPGILAAAHAFGLDFIPLQEERYDLVIPTEHLASPVVQALLEVAVSPICRAEVEALGGYDSSRAGTLIAELTA